jgi:HEPN domain-containing protein
VPRRYPPDDPREWLNRAKSALSLAQARREGVYWEDLCYQAQQAAEKAIKAVLIRQGVDFSYVHDIAELLVELESAGGSVPGAVKRAARLTRFAVFTRYPAPAAALRRMEWAEAVALAQEVVTWAESLLAEGEPGEPAEP